MGQVHNLEIYIQTHYNYLRLVQVSNKTENNS